jgi:hypothetical protein
MSDFDDPLDEYTAALVELMGGWTAYFADGVTDDQAIYYLREVMGRFIFEAASKKNDPSRN